MGSTFRPVLALDEPEGKSDVEVVFLTTKSNLQSVCLRVNESDFDGIPLPFISYVNISKKFLISSALLEKRLAKLKSSCFEKIIKEIVFHYSKSFYESKHRNNDSGRFIPGKSRVPYAGRVFDEKELTNLIDASLDFWLTAGPWSDKFEERFSDFLGVDFCHLVNSGSSANLLAFMALTSDVLGKRKIEKGDEVITVAAAFPTTVAPIVQYGAVPVFVDVTLPTYNIDCDRLEEALSPKTKAVLVAHTLGNPFDIDRIKSFCDKRGLWLIEDNCDALGSKYYSKSFNGFSRKNYTGGYGDIGTSSFYPPHHLTMGEGGAVYTNNATLSNILLSFRDWGRDCTCKSGQDNRCGNRFNRKLGDLPLGYDHKYIYSHFGYNLKATDLQAAIGCAQLEKLPEFICKRRENFDFLKSALKQYSGSIILPEATMNSEPSWFGFLITLNDAKLDRQKIVNTLEKNNIQTRMLFSGNLIKHPCFDSLRASKSGYRVIGGDLKNTDRIMNDTFWIGVYPGLLEEHLNFMVKTICGVLD
ncbi:MAG: lipopolysaccharide biosynthesis protein RfbH [Candidatus Riflebacteria bacterium]|nr:lipopolysaccharide biosynthesis protein RfbH [Candidatus Riflebacteria bacterium]